jgi:hypothetical protein
MTKLRLVRSTFAGAGALLALLLFANSAIAATVYWELVPQKDSQVPVGTYTVVGGNTSPDGVHFTLKNNNANAPVALTLVSTGTKAPLHLSAFKDAAPFLNSDTNADGSLTVRFRTGDDMNFNVTGPAGSSYQLAVWRGPQIVAGESDAIVSMASVTGSNAVAGPTGGASSAPAPVPRHLPLLRSAVFRARSCMCFSPAF